MEFKHFVMSPQEAGRRLDKTLKILTKDIPGVKEHEIIRKKLVKVNQKNSKPDYIIQENDTISIAAFLFEKVNPVISEKNRSSAIVMQNSFSPETLFKNQHIWIINKPTGINVQPAKEGDFSISQWFSSTSTTAAFTPAPLHRLDKNTSGVLAVSQSLTGAKWFTQNIQDHTITKTYYGILTGIVGNQIEWKDVITPRPNSVLVDVTAPQKENTSNSITRIWPLAQGNYKGTPFTFCRINIVTGKKHQIRAQSAFHGHPLLGDVSYGNNVFNGKRTFFLHAAVLEFPKDNPLELPEQVKAPLPKDLSKFLQDYLKNQDQPLII